MTEIRFYHLTTRPLESALPEILEKVYERGQRAVVKAAGKDEMTALADHLWTYSQESFLPHGTTDDDYAAQQPVYLTTQEEYPNSATILILTGGAESDKIKDFELCCEMLDGHNPEQLQAARERWKRYKDEGYELTYWMQDERGRWQKKDV